MDGGAYGAGVYDTPAAGGESVSAPMGAAYTAPPTPPAAGGAAPAAGGAAPYPTGGAAAPPAGVAAPSGTGSVTNSSQPAQVTTSGVDSIRFSSKNMVASIASLALVAAVFL